jgi:hypothetical protein
VTATAVSPAPVAGVAALVAAVSRAPLAGVAALVAGAAALVAGLPAPDVRW